MDLAIPTFAQLISRKPHVQLANHVCEDLYASRFFLEFFIITGSTAAYMRLCIPQESISTIANFINIILYKIAKSYAPKLVGKNIDSVSAKIFLKSQSCQGNCDPSMLLYKF